MGAGHPYGLAWTATTPGIECVRSQRWTRPRASSAMHTTTSPRAGYRLWQRHHDKEVTCWANGTTRKPECALAAPSRSSRLPRRLGCCELRRPRNGVRHGQGRSRCVDRRQRDDHLHLQPDDRAAGQTAGRTHDHSAGRARRRRGQHARGGSRKSADRRLPLETTLATALNQLSGATGGLVSPQAALRQVIEDEGTPGAAGSNGASGANGSGGATGASGAGSGSGAGAGAGTPGVTPAKKRLSLRAGSRSLKGRPGSSVRVRFNVSSAAKLSYSGRKLAKARAR